MPPQNSNAGLMVNVFDGSRHPVSKKLEILVRVIDGFQKHLAPKTIRKPSILFRNLRVFDNLGDNYTVLVSADDHIDAGFTPVKIKRGTVQHLDLMLIPREPAFNFAMSKWNILETTHPELIALLSAGVKTDSAARDRYEDLLENRGEVLAAFLNIVTAMVEIHLAAGNPVDYLKELIWDDMTRDRFFAWADKKLVEQVGRATHDGLFSPEVGSAVFHKGATKSFKQVQYGDANVQLTFHEDERRRIDGVECVQVEPDIDYHKDLAAHTLLEVIPNSFTGRLTNPAHVYALRWIASRQPGVPEFQPPYSII